MNSILNIKLILNDIILHSNVICIKTFTYLGVNALMQHKTVYICLGHIGFINSFHNNPFIINSIVLMFHEFDPNNFHVVLSSSWKSNGSKAFVEITLDLQGLGSSWGVYLFLFVQRLQDSYLLPAVDLQNLSSCSTAASPGGFISCPGLLL